MQFDPPTTPGFLVERKIRWLDVQPIIQRLLHCSTASGSLPTNSLLEWPKFRASMEDEKDIRNDVLVSAIIALSCLGRKCSRWLLRWLEYEALATADRLDVQSCANEPRTTLHQFYGRYQRKGYFWGAWAAGLVTNFARPLRFGLE